MKRFLPLENMQAVKNGWAKNNGFFLGFVPNQLLMEAKIGIIDESEYFSTPQSAKDADALLGGCGECYFVVEYAERENKSTDSKRKQNPRGRRL